MNSISKNNIKTMIANGNIEKAISSILSYTNKIRVPDSNQLLINSFGNKITLISGRYKEIKNQEILGIADYQSISIEKNKINFAFIDFVDNLPEYFWSIEKLKRADKDYSKNTSISRGESDFDYDLFLCYSSLDKKEVKKIWKRLTNVGFKVFFSDEALKDTAGNSFINSIQSALLKSKNFLLYSTPQSMQSEWVQAEYETFFNECYLKNKKNRKLIILKGSFFDIVHVPVLFRRLQFADNLDIVVSILKPISEIKTKKENSQKKSQVVRNPNIDKKNIGFKLYNEFYIILFLPTIFFIPSIGISAGKMPIVLWFFSYCLMVTLIAENKNKLSRKILFQIIAGIVGMTFIWMRGSGKYGDWWINYSVILLGFIALIIILNFFKKK